MEKELRKKREQEEFEKDLELLRLKMAEEERKREELERIAYLEQEENDRKALIEKQKQFEEEQNAQTSIEQNTEVPILDVSSFKDEQVQPKITEDTQITEEIHKTTIEESESEKVNFPIHILPMNFEILVNQAIQNEFKNPNIPIQLEALKLEEAANAAAAAVEANSCNDETSLTDKNIELPKLEFPPAQVELFEQWHRHNMNNFFEIIKQEYETKIRQKESKKKTQQRPRPRTSKTKESQNIPESLLLKKSNKNSLVEINFLYFHALTSYTLNSLELCINLTVLVLTKSQITILDGLSNCVNLKFMNVHVSSYSHQCLLIIIAYLFQVKQN